MKVSKRTSSRKSSKYSKKRQHSSSKKRSSKKRVSKGTKRVKRKSSKRKSSKKSRASKRYQHGGITSQYGSGFSGDLFHITSFAEKEKEKTILDHAASATQQAVDATTQTLGAVAGATKDLAVGAYKNVTSFFSGPKK